ncbi:hypothetical protein PG985_008229 [Apiospora marii]|uniref:Uncharacterized protein n=1 Tax=Apiospora marii TaxID=335849 RepID=A0ABR1RBR4_9PEZI
MLHGMIRPNPGRSSSTLKLAQTEQRQGISGKETNVYTAIMNGLDREIASAVGQPHRHPLTKALSFRPANEGKGGKQTGLVLGP